MMQPFPVVMPFSITQFRWKACLSRRGVKSSFVNVRNAPIGPTSWSFRAAFLTAIVPVSFRISSLEISLSCIPCTPCIQTGWENQQAAEILFVECTQAAPHMTTGERGM